MMRDFAAIAVVILDCVTPFLRPAELELHLLGYLAVLGSDLHILSVWKPQCLTGSVEVTLGWYLPLLLRYREA